MYIEGYCTNFVEEGKSYPGFFGYDTLYLSPAFNNVHLSLGIPRNLDIDALEEKDLSFNVDYDLSLGNYTLSSAPVGSLMTVDIDWGDEQGNLEGGSVYCWEESEEPSLVEVVVG